MGANFWKFFLISADAWEAMLADCEQAVVSIDFEQFIFTYDEIGRKFYRLFLKKAQEGVKVRLLLDAGGSYAFFNSIYHKELIKQGVEVKFFNPIIPLRLKKISSFFFRDHRKLMIVDGRISYTGGVGIEERMRNWRDTQVKLIGPVVKNMAEAFEKVWQTIYLGYYQRLKKSNSGEDMVFLINAPHWRQRQIYHELLRAIKSSEKYIYLTTPYFVPSQRLLLALRRAAKRNVDVRILIPENSDHNLADYASSSYFGLLLKPGVRIFKYQGRVMHAKTAVVDDNWATIGSANYDNLSFIYNYEGNIVATNQEFVLDIKQQFAHDLLSAKEVDLNVWLKRPIKQRFYEYLTWPFHGIL